MQSKKTEGVCYGTNQVTGKRICHHRTKNGNPNALIFGLSVTGKTVAVKSEIRQMMAKEDAGQIFVIDPCGEYTTLAKELDGTVLSMMPGKDIFINPLDFYVPQNDDDKADAVCRKSDLLMGFLELIYGRSLTPQEKSTVDAAVSQLYASYLKELQQRGISFDASICPTMMDFYHLLKKQNNKYARELALAMEVYCVNGFLSARTNVTLTNSFIVYDVSQLSEVVKPVIQAVCLEQCISQMKMNAEKRTRTHIYMEGLEKFFWSPVLSYYLAHEWTTARLFYGDFCGVLQDVKTFGSTHAGKKILRNTGFVMIFTQDAINRERFAELYHIPEKKLQYIAQGKPGECLLVRGNEVEICSMNKGEK